MSKNLIINTLIILIILGFLIYIGASLALKFTLTPGYGGKKRSLDNSVGYKSPNDIKTYQNKKRFIEHRNDWILSVQKNTKEISITTDDGYTQYGHIYLQEKSNEHTPWIIILHGYFGGEGESQTHASYLYELGYNILTYSLRAHGTSEGKYTTMANKEADDLIIWTNKIIEKYPQAPIIYHGTSMGGATVINASGRCDLPKNVVALVDDCGYSDTWEILGLELKNASVFLLNHF